MLSEVRTLIFPKADLQEALMLQLQKEMSELPGGIDWKLDIQHSPKLRVALGGRVADSSDEHWINAEPEEIVKGMLRYCLDSSIPIPKSAKKSLEQVGDKLALKILINEDTLSVTDNSYFVLL